MLSKYGNALLMVAAAIVSVLTAALADGQVSQVEGVNVAIALLGALAIHPAAVTSYADYVKWAMAFLVAGLTAAATYVGAGGFQSITSTEIFQIIVAAAAAVLAGATAPKTTAALLAARRTTP